MNNEELKQALLEHSIVIYKGTEYYLSGIIYRASGKEIKISVELADKNGKSVLYALPRDLERAKQ